MSVDPNEPQSHEPQGQEPGTGDSTSSSSTAESTRTETFSTGYVEKLRRENAAYRVRAEQADRLEKRATEAEARLKAAEDEKLSEAERLAKRLAELEQERSRWETERQERTTRYELRLKAAELGFADPADAYALIDLTTVEYGDDGSPTNAERLLKDLLKAKPYLAKQGTEAVPASPRPGQPPDREKLIAEKVEKLRASGVYSRFG